MAAPFLPQPSMLFAGGRGVQAVRRLYPTLTLCQVDNRCGGNNNNNSLHSNNSAFTIDPRILTTPLSCNFSYNFTDEEQVLSNAQKRKDEQQARLKRKLAKENALPPSQFSPSPSPSPPQAAQPQPNGFKQELEDALSNGHINHVNNPNPPRPASPRVPSPGPRDPGGANSAAAAAVGVILNQERRNSLSGHGELKVSPRDPLSNGRASPRPNLYSNVGHGGHGVSPEADLEQKQRETLQTFQSITGTRDWGQCELYLTLFDFDLQSAVTHFMDSDGNLQTAIKKKQEALEKSQAKQEETRIEIVYPTGESNYHTFKVTDTLWTVYTTVLEKAHLWGHRPFNLTKTLPKTVYTEDKFNLTLKEAGLTPKSTLTVVVV